MELQDSLLTWPAVSEADRLSMAPGAMPPMYSMPLSLGNRVTDPPSSLVDRTYAVIHPALCMPELAAQKQTMEL
eukprot:1155843-Pelagomonas_calceolata.AAC.3